LQAKGRVDEQEIKRLLKDLDAAQAEVANKQEGEEEEMQKGNAVAALWSLVLGNDANQVALAAAGGIPPLVALLREGTEKQKEKAAKAMSYLAFTRDIKLAIIEAGGITPLVALVRDGTDMQKENAMAALLKLLFYMHNDNPIVWKDAAIAIGLAGAIPPLVDLVRDGTDAQKEYAVQVLKGVTSEFYMPRGQPENMFKFAALNAGAIAPLVALVRNGTEIQKECAAATLSQLLAYGVYRRLHPAPPDVRMDPKLELVQADGFPPLLEMLRNGTEEQQIIATYVLMFLTSIPGGCHNVSRTPKIPSANLDIIPPLLALLVKLERPDDQYSRKVREAIYYHLWYAAMGCPVFPQDRESYDRANKDAAVIAAITAAGGLPPLRRNPRLAPYLVKVGIPPFGN